MDRERTARMPGKRVQFDEETWLALDLLARDRMMDFQELADEAFADLLRKHERRSVSRRPSGKASAKPPPRAQATPAKSCPWPAAAAPAARVRPGRRPEAIAAEAATLYGTAAATDGRRTVDRRRLHTGLDAEE